MKASNLYVVLGQLALAVSIILNHFLKETTPVSFAIGILAGLSIGLNIIVIWVITKDKRE